MTIPIRLTPRVLVQTASDLEKDAADMEARAAEVEHEQQQDGSFHTANHLQSALYAAAKEARRAADSYRKTATYAEALANMLAAPVPVCPGEFLIFDAATLEQAEGLYVWRGAAPIPAEGERVQVTHNGLGSGKVAGYFLAGEAGKADPDHPERRFLGVAVLLETPPDWYKAQSPNWQSAPAHVFGPEVAPLE